MVATSLDINMLSLDAEAAKLRFVVTNGYVVNKIVSLTFAVRVSL